jgi:hypothetical protein
LKRIRIDHSEGVEATVPPKASFPEISKAKKKGILASISSSSNVKRSTLNSSISSKLDSEDEDASEEGIDSSLNQEIKQFVTKSRGLKLHLFN